MHKDPSPNRSTFAGFWLLSSLAMIPSALNFISSPSKSSDSTAVTYPSEFIFIFFERVSEFFIFGFFALFSKYYFASKHQ